LQKAETSEELHCLLTNIESPPDAVGVAPLCSPMSMLTCKTNEPVSGTNNIVF
jgi:hypothetical protein